MGSSGRGSGAAGSALGRWSAVLLRAAAGLSGPAQWWPLLVAALPPWQPTPLATSFSWLRLVALTLSRRC